MDGKVAPSSCAASAGRRGDQSMERARCQSEDAVAAMTMRKGMLTAFSYFYFIHLFV